MFERHVTFTVREGQEGDFESFFEAEYGPTMAQAPGCIRVELIREVEHPLRYRMVMRWRDADSGAAWRASSPHAALRPKLKALHVSTEVIEYVVVS